jgi:hypothetical protein
MLIKINKKPANLDTRASLTNEIYRALIVKSMLHCCRLQAVYSPITVKNFVILYTPAIEVRKV